MKNIDQLEGRNVVIEALSSGRNIKSLLLDSGAKDDPKVFTIKKLARKNKVKIKEVKRAFLDKISKTNAHQGVIAIAPKKRSMKLLEIINNNNKKGKNSFFLMVDQLTYEQNLGAMIRTAYSAGVDAVILSNRGVSEITSVVSHISAGASEHIQVINEGLYSAIKKMNNNNIKIVGVEKGASKKHFEADLGGAVAIVMGGEDKGLSENIREKCDELIEIPMMNDFSSLNVSVATGIVLYEKVRQDMKK